MGILLVSCDGKVTTICKFGLHVQVMQIQSIDFEVLIATSVVEKVIMKRRWVHGLPNVLKIK